jgi:hypothetical protein
MRRRSACRTDFNRTEFQRAVHLASKNASMLRQFINGSCSLEETSDIMERLARGELKAFKMIIGGRLE